MAEGWGGGRSPSIPSPSLPLPSLRVLLSASAPVPSLHTVSTFTIAVKKYTLPICSTSPKAPSPPVVADALTLPVSSAAPDPSKAAWPSQVLSTEHTAPSGRNKPHHSSSRSKRSPAWWIGPFRTCKTQQQHQQQQQPILDAVYH
jgi:hypothetical protein